MTRWWLVLALGVLAFYFLNFSTPSLPGKYELKVIRDEPDVLMEFATITKFEKTGFPGYRLQASEIRHFEGKGLTRLINPSLTVHQEGQPPWSAESRHGYIRQETAAGELQDAVFLRENVVLERLGPSRDRIRLVSESMVVYPQRQYAKTDQPVTIDTVAGRSIAQSMTADLSKGLINMSSDAKNRVHSIVLPDQFE